MVPLTDDEIVGRPFLFLDTGPMPTKASKEPLETLVRRQRKKCLLPSGIAFILGLKADTCVHSDVAFKVKAPLLIHIPLFRSR